MMDSRNVYGGQTVFLATSFDSAETLRAAVPQHLPTLPEGNYDVLLYHKLLDERLGFEAGCSKTRVSKRLSGLDRTKCDMYLKVSSSSKPSNAEFSLVFSGRGLPEVVI